MYVKLALGNVKKSVRDFSVFFLTLVFGVCVFYAFNSVMDQTAVMELTRDQRTSVEDLLGILNGVSVFVAVILGFLVVYANRFLIRRRKREFGIYLTLGMDIRHVSLIVVVETLVVGVVALAVGLVLGVVASQLIMYVTASLFEAKINGFVFAFSPASCVTTVLCFACIFVVSLVFNVVTVSRYKLIDLLNAEHVGEKVRLRSLPVSVVLFVVSLALIGWAYRTLLTYGIMDEGGHFGQATLLVTVGTLLFFFSISGFLLRVLQSAKGVYLRGLNMFVLRQLNSRINTAWLSISLVCAMLFLAICSVCTGFSITTDMNRSLERGAAYDATLTAYPTASSDGLGDDPAAYGYSMEAALREKAGGWDALVEKGVQVDRLYSAPEDDPAITLGAFTKLVDANDADRSAVLNQALAGSDDLPLSVVSASQFNALRQLKGLDPIDLGESGYLVWSDIELMNDFWREALEGSPAVSVWGRELSCVRNAPVSDVALGNQTSGGTCGDGIVVVPDSAIPASAQVNTSTLCVMYRTPGEATDKALYQAVEAVYPSQIDSQYLGDTLWPVFGIVTASEVVAMTGATTVSVTYLAIYIGFVLLVSCASVLALQQLSEAADNQARYRVLFELGAEPRMVSRALFVQVGVYFVFPLAVALVHSAVALSQVSDLVSLLTGYQIGSALPLVTGFVIVLYGGYFAVTYLTSKGILLRARVRS